jgi:hypothetical protein
MYAGLFAAFVLLFQRENDQLVSSLVALVVAVIGTTILISVFYKFGWSPAFLKTRGELQAIRAERIAQRQASRAARRGQPMAEPERYRPAPTKRTSTGATNRPRRTRDTRKR